MVKRKIKLITVIFVLAIAALLFISVGRTMKTVRAQSNAERQGAQSIAERQGAENTTETQGAQSNAEAQGAENTTEAHGAKSIAEAQGAESNAERQKRPQNAKNATSNAVTVATMTIAKAVPSTTLKFAREPSKEDLSTFGYEVPGEFVPKISEKAEITAGELKGYLFENYRFGYAIYKPAEGENNGDVLVYARGGENARLVGGALAVDSLAVDEIVSSYMVCYKNMLGAKYGEIVENEFEAFLKECVTGGAGTETKFNFGIGQNNCPYAFNMSGIRFRYGDSQTGNFSVYGAGEYNHLSLYNSFVAVVSNATDGKVTDSGYSYYMLRDGFYEEYVKQFAAGKGFGSVISSDNTNIKIDGVVYKGQLFSGGYMYKKNGRIIADNSKVYDPLTETFTKGTIENYLMTPSWFKNEPYTEMIKVNDNLYYFNYGENVCEARILAGGEYEYKYYARRLYNKISGKMEIVRYEQDDISIMGKDTALWNGEASLAQIKSYYPDMDQSTTLRQFEFDVKEAMWEAYERYSNLGFSLGQTSGENIMLWGKCIKIGFQGAQFDEQYIDGYEKVFLMYNPVLKKSFAFYGPLISACYGLNNPGGIDNITQVGAPVEELTYIDEGIYAGSWYQNFTEGYMFVEKSFADMVKFKAGEYYEGAIPLDAAKNEEALKQKAEREEMMLGGDKESGCGAKASAIMAGVLAAALSLAALKRGGKVL